MCITNPSRASTPIQGPSTTPTPQFRAGSKILTDPDLAAVDREPGWVDSAVERVVDFWPCEVLKRTVTRLSAASGYSPEDVDARPISYENSR